MAVEHGETFPFVPGYIESPPDERDYQIDDLYAQAGVEKPAVDALATALNVAYMPLVLNQGLTPMCVAYSASAMKDSQDYDDAAVRRHWNFDEPTFFRQIGGTSQGAVLRNALNRLVAYGYPVVANASPASAHRVTSYWAVPKTKYDVMAALSAFRTPLYCGSTWYHSWCSYGFETFPAADYGVGGHAWIVVGYNAAGVIVQNSWGTGWGHGDGRATMPWSMFLSRVREIWKVQDR